MNDMNFRAGVSPTALDLGTRLENKQAVIGIVGMGYVGLPLFLRYLDVGYRVVGFDIDQTKIDALNRGESYIQHIDGSAMTNAESDRYRGTSDFADIKDVDTIILCLPTPLDDHREPDLSYVLNSMDLILPHMRKGQVLSFESTTYPGTTDEELAPLIEKAGHTIGEDVFLVYSPEREDPGNPNFTTSTIPKVYSGITPSCKHVGAALYGHVIDELVPVSSTRTAEMTKILENTYRAVNIALVNELKLVSDPMGIDIFEAIRAAATKPFGFTPFYPGPGLGGHCIPIDPFYLTWKAREYELTTRFIELAGETNSKMPDYVITRITDALNTQSRSVKGSRILVLGASYKKNVDDMRESPSVVIMQKLEERGAQVSYADPFVPKLPTMRRFDLGLEAIELDNPAVASFDCVVVSTDHDDFDWEMIQRTSRLIVDTRGRFTADNERIFRA